jgi:integrase
MSQNYYGHSKMLTKLKRQSSIMNGSITRRGKHSWRIGVDLGRDENGKRRRQFETVNGTKAEAQRKLRELVSTVENGLFVPATRATVGEFMQQWLRDYAQTNTCPRTAEGYRGNVRRYITPKLGSIPLAKLAPRHIQGLYSDMLGRGLSPRTVLQTHRVLRQALSHAVKWGLIMHNAGDAVFPPRPRHTEMQALDADAVQTLLQATSGSPYGHIIFLAVYTGLRRGELAALKWSDIDLKNRALSVNRALVRITGEGLQESEPKTARSRRLVSLPPGAVILLSGLKSRQKDRHEVAGRGWSETGYVFCDTAGKPVHPDLVSHAFNRAIKKAGLPPVRFHDLRHTHATLMLKQGVQPKIVSERLGHSSTAITMDIYSHVLPGMQETAAQAFEDCLNGTPEGKPAL